MIKAGIITASDRAAKGLREDQSGPLLKSLLENLPAETIAYKVLPDEPEMLKKAMSHCADRLACDLLFTTGGTGLGPRDHTPEVTRALIEREIPGIPEAVRQASARHTPFAMLSRMAAGTRGKTLIINLPGSPEAVRESFEILRPVLVHAVKLVRGTVGDCREVREKECRTHWRDLSPSSHLHS